MISYKLIKCFIRQWIYNDKFLRYCNHNKTRYKVSRIFIEYCKTKFGKNSFSLRVATLWNSLKNNLKCAPNITSLKITVDQSTIMSVNKSNYDK